MYKRYEIVHNGTIYHAVVCEYELKVWYEADWFRQEEFHGGYKTLSGAKNKLKKYFKGETVEWREIE